MRLLCERPAEIFGISHRKGRIEIGMDADLVVLDPAAEREIHGRDQHGNTDYSLFDGWRASYLPTFSMQRGRPILFNGEVVAGPGEAQFIAATGDYDPREEED